MRQEGKQDCGMQANSVARKGFSAASMTSVDGQELQKPQEELLMMSVV